jgi:uncharacterized membrane protein YvbJ
METKHHEGRSEPSEQETQGAQPQNQNLETIKEEILKEIKQKKRKKINWASGSITAVLVILTLFSVAQAVQMANVWKKIKSGAVAPAGAATSPSAPLPSSVQNLPNMVGGC